MIFTRVDLPAPFSPSSATTEPPTASRSTPCRTSTPPNDFRISRASRRKPSVTCAPLAVGARLRVQLADVGRRHRDVRDEQVRRHLLALRGLDQVRDADLAVALG